MKQSGFSIIEVLVTILIVSFGIMGLAGLQAQMLIAESESVERAQAVIFLEDMAARLNASRGSVNSTNASYFVIAPTAPVGAVSVDPCARDSTITNLVEREAEFQICEWTTLLRGSTTKVGTTFQIEAPDMRGCIELLGTTPVQYRVSVTWRGRSQSFTPAALTCASGVYGAEANGRRRLVSSIVTVPDLSAL